MKETKEMTLDEEVKGYVNIRVWYIYNPKLYWDNKLNRIKDELLSLNRI